MLLNACQHILIPPGRPPLDAEHGRLPALALPHALGECRDRRGAEQPRACPRFGQRPAERQLLEQKFAPLASADKQQFAPVEQAHKCVDQVGGQAIAYLHGMRETMRRRADFQLGGDQLIVWWLEPWAPLEMRAHTQQMAWSV